MLHIGVVNTTFCQEEGKVLQTYRDGNGRCIGYFSKLSGSGVDNHPGRYDYKTIP